ncbi:MAG TPA: glycosyltransferase [Candidatus Aquilonibacter sp.]|nr:glycosyltransferase [Candidatus Aquilonibacter sp.]
MNILLTLRQPLVPADTGGKVRSLNIFSRLAKRASIHAVSFADPVHEAAAISEMKHIFSSYTPVAWRESKKYSPTFYAGVLAAQFGSWPYFLSKCNRLEFVSTVRALEKRHRFQLLFCDFLHTAAPLMSFPFRPKIVFEHNVEFLLRKRKWVVETNPVRRMILKNEWTKTRAIEERACRNCDGVLAVSEDDRQAMLREFGVANVSVLPTGVDTDFFQPSQVASRPGRIVFVGSMDWDPNEDGIAWFLRDIYPSIRRGAPMASLAVVGRNPSPHLRALASRQPDVDLTGRVADVRPYLASAEVVIVPLRVGGGTRIKIPEAMAMRKAVVSTTIGAEGLPFRKGREICIADNPEDFAETVITLLHDRQMRNAIAGAARNVVVEKHGWDAVVDRMEEAIDAVVNSATAPEQLAPAKSPSEQLYA